MVMDDFVKSGHGEWEDPDVRTRCRILWRKPEELASDIYDWAVANGYINNVCTVYELHSGEFCMGRGGCWCVFVRFILLLIIARRSSLLALCIGEDVNGMSFQGVDEDFLRRALGILKQQKKCTIFGVNNDGIKFF